ncbi:MAG: hypothetical protein ACYCRD_00005, partial [Leptospirillum sp.]
WASPRTCSQNLHVQKTTERHVCRLFLTFYVLELRTNVEICISKTGVVSGEFGMVKAFQERSAEITPWLDDERPQVKAFAERYIRRLDERIKFEQRSAEQRKALRKLEFDSEG